MATQALYRRYRPRRFGEVRGQEHIVRALRNAVIHHREGQAYLFSGPRGTGKTTSARILAKVLNCERPVDGEPCCECDSCLAVERGTSYDVHELDAASNNGVDAMRDLIEKASLGTPGRHKVYILDEVHMLSKAAEAALLKTLEEPPPHVVFVLATTDPQKVSDTIRSRTQHLRFHLLPMDELEQHIRWVAEDAGLQVSEAAIMAALEQGGGSARDTLSALELVATTGGDDLDVVPYGEFVESLIEFDPGRALTAVAHAVQQGRDARALTEDVVRYLRDCFLSLMAPELVALPDSRAGVVAEQASRLGAAKVVKAMERLGEILVEMRHAPDPRLLLEVALVQLTHQAVSHDVGALMDRIDRLERALAEGVAKPSAPAVTPVDPATGRVPLGARARRDATGAAPRPTVTTPARTPDSPPPAPVVASPASPRVRR
ncbi:MAG: DNA polymerase III subunit gamma/tau [Acidimicrobiaceae bacterium]|nr:DNA polymerase III subunit gamma/tau [Acidimicrobiaceae bacterium]